MIGGMKPAMKFQWKRLINMPNLFCKLYLTIGAFDNYTSPNLITEGL